MSRQFWTVVSVLFFWAILLLIALQRIEAYIVALNRSN